MQVTLSIETTETGGLILQADDLPFYFRESCPNMLTWNEVAAKLFNQLCIRSDDVSFVVRRATGSFAKSARDYVTTYLETMAVFEHQTN